MKRVLITGITGYIGSHLAKALMAEYEVCGLVRTPLHTAYIAGFQDRLRLLPVDGTSESIQDLTVRRIRPNWSNPMWHSARISWRQCPPAGSRPWRMPQPI